MDSKLTIIFLNYIYQCISLYPCVMLCYLPFNDMSRLVNRKAAAVSAPICAVFAALAVAFERMGYDIAAPVIAIMFLSVGFIYYWKTVCDGLHKLLFVFFIVVHVGSIGSELEYAVTTIAGVLPMASRKIILWFVFFILLRIVLYSTVGFIIYRVFTPRLKQIKSEDMRGLWVLPVFFAVISIYRGAYYYIKNTLDSMFTFLFVILSVLSFLVYGLMLRMLDTITQNANAKIKQQELAYHNAALDRLNRQRAELVATISHETMTPLAVLSGYAELVAMELREKGVDEQTARDLDKIAEETQRISWLMDELKNHTRESNEHLFKTKLNLTKLIESVARIYTPIMARKATGITVHIPNSLPDVYACANEITQVLFNALQNARNHTDNGMVTIAATEGDYQVIVTVSDTGGGIPTEILTCVFERGVSGSVGGNGLGLSISKKIIENHCGVIDIESEIGIGTTLRFTLPIWRGENDA